MTGWTAYLLTFITYALIHAVRTSWSYIKTFSQTEPLNFSTQFLGELDMIILICLSVSLKTLGWIGEKIGHKNFLLIGMSYLTLTFMLVGILQIVGVSHHWVYILLYAMIGIASCTGWPSCLSIVSLYYPPKENGFKLCIWNGCSQFGDFVALGLGYFLVEVCKAKPQSLILTICGLMLVMIAVNWFFLVLPQKSRSSVIQEKREPPQQQQLEQQQNKSSNADYNNREHAVSPQQPVVLTEEKPVEPELPPAAPDSLPNDELRRRRSTRSRSGATQKKVNFLNVWLLPSVASYVLCFACLKSVNAIIMSWLLFYLFSIGLHKFSSSITVAWSICIFLGSLAMGYYNNSVNKIGLIVPLLFTAFIFAYLGAEYERNSGYHYLVMMILSGLCFGGPYGLIGSKITLLLGKNPKIRDRQGAVGAIISVMEGFGLFCGAFFVLIVPYMGLKHLFYLPSILCIISSAILFLQHRKEIQEDYKETFKRREEELREEYRMDVYGKH